MAKKSYEESSIQAIADAIREKTGTTDTYKVSEMAGAVREIEAGGGAATQKQSGYCTFYDYDGTVVEAWSKEELENATALPDNPTHEGLISQGWNWTLEDLKALGRECETGQLYVTDDGKTRIYITLEEGRTSPMLGCCPNGTVTVDWGDGTTPDILTGTSTSTTIYTPVHNYKNAGDYVITLAVDGALGFDFTGKNRSHILLKNTAGNTQSEVYGNCITKIEVGNLERLGQYACGSLKCLETLTMSAGCTLSMSYHFSNCYMLKCLIVSKGSVGYYGVQGAYAMKCLILPNGGTSLTSNGIRNTRMSHFIIPNTVATIDSYALSSNLSLTRLVVPEGVTKINSYAFSSCSGMKEYHIKPTTPPTLSNTNAFYGIPEDCIMYVPKGTLEAYQMATNWSTYADYMREAEE